ncbi:beta-1,4-mannosyl-glycoprotein 4-beta-N-acetylglucosaminyltransferase-like isoform X1 [Haemaphysalis longicornis]
MPGSRMYFLLFSEAIKRKHPESSTTTVGIIPAAMSPNRRKSVLLFCAFSVFLGTAPLFLKYTRCVHCTCQNASTLDDGVVRAKVVSSENPPIQSTGLLQGEHSKRPLANVSALRLAQCFKEGTVPGLENRMCVCLPGWHGVECSVPEAVWRTLDFQEAYAKGQIKRRSKPRTLINGLVFNHELDLLDIRVKELGDAVDYYVIAESNYTYFGSPKGLHLRANLSAGFLREYRHKIITLALGVYNYENGDPWAPENYCYTSVWREGQHRLPSLRDDDLFWLSDADEIPNRDVLLFLKHHDGYGEPLALALRWFLYGFFWEKWEPVDVGGVCTVAYMRHVLGNDSLRLRRMRAYAKLNSWNTGTVQGKWTLRGTAPRYAGWHCSWCFSTRGIQVKLASAQRDDGIRWGDFANKSDLAYIESLRKSGQFFDHKGKLKACDPNDTAPAYVKNNQHLFPYLMVA